MKIFHINNSRGYAIIFSVVVISVIVIVTLAVSAIVEKELELSSIGQQSMEAFFAADAGIECALFADIASRDQEIFPRENAPMKNSFTSCAGYSVSGRRSSGAYPNRDYSFDIRNNTSDTCASILVEVRGPDTTVKATGYNTCDTGAGRVERGLEVRY